MKDGEEGVWEGLEGEKGRRKCNNLKIKAIHKLLFFNYYCYIYAYINKYIIATYSICLVLFVCIIFRVDHLDFSTT